MINCATALRGRYARVLGRESEGRTGPDRNLMELSFESALEAILFGGVGSDACPAATNASRCLWRQVLTK